MSFILANSDSVGISGLLKRSGGYLALMSLSNTCLDVATSKTFSIPSGAIMQTLIDDSLIIVSRDGMTTMDSQNGSIKSKLTIQGIVSSVRSTNSIYFATEGKVIKRVLIENGSLSLSDLELKGNTGRICSMAVNSDETLLVTGDDQRRIQLYDLRTFSLISTKWCFHASTVTSLSWSPDGQTLASGGLDNTIFVWKPAESKVRPIKELRRTSYVT